MKASLEGWKETFAHPREALEIVMRNLTKIHIPATRVHQKWMLARMKDLILPDGDDTPMGTLKPEDYRRVAESLKENGLIKGIPELSQFQRNYQAHEEK